VGWIAAGILCLILLIVVGIVVLLHSSKFHQYVLNKARTSASEALGTNIAIGDYTLTWSGISPTIDVYRITVEGAPPHPTPPLLQVEHARVGVTITSLLHRTWYLNDLEVHQPVVRLFVDKDGKNNIPTAKKKQQSQSNTDVFDLGVRHAVLDGGVVYYNDRKSLMDADLKDLTFQAGFDPSQTKYSGTLSYRDGHLKMQNFNPIPHDLDAKFNATRQRFTLEQAVLRSGASKVTLDATVDDYTNPKINAKYDALVDAGEFRRILKNATIPTGTIRLAGHAQYASDPNKLALETATLNGTLSSGGLHVTTPQFKGDIRDIGASYSLANGNADVRDLHARLLGGELVANLTVRNITGASRSHMTAQLRGVSLADLKPMANTQSLENVSLGGTVNADADATWGKTMNDLLATANATINGRVAPANGAANATPLDGVIHARYAAANKQITLANSFITTGQTSINLNGTVSDRSALQIRMQSNDLHELETLADAFETAKPGQPAPQPLGLYGTANFNGAVSGSTAAPHITGQLVANNLRVKGSSWRLLRTNVDASPSMARLQNGELDPADKGRITFNLSAGLHHWAFTKTSPVTVQMNGSQLNVAELAKAAGSQTPVSGTLNMNVQVHGSELNPVGQGSINLTQAKVAGEPIQSASVKFNGTGDAVHANLNVTLPAGAANGVVTYYPKQEGYDAQLTANGIKLNQLQTVKEKNLDVNGVLNVNASGRGTFDNPQLTATVQVPQLQMHGQTISGLNLQTNVANHVANIALDSSVVNTQVRGRGTVKLVGDYPADITLDTQTIPFAPLVAAYAPSQAGNITGQTELHATLRGPLKDKTRMEAHIVIPTLEANYKNTVQLGAASPIHADYVNGTLTLQRAVLRGTDTDLQFGGTVPVASNAPMSLMLLGTVDLRLASLFNPDITSSGQLKFNINSNGQRSDPNVQGQIQIVNANFATGDAPVGLANGNGVLTLTKDRLIVTRFDAQVGGGPVSMSGGINYRPGVRFDLALAGRNIRMLYPEGVREGLDIKLALAGTTQNANLTGTVNVDQLSFTPDFDIMDMMGQFGGTTTPPPAQGFSNDLHLNLVVRSTNGINLVSRTLSLAGAANLQVRGTAAEPVVLGRINLSGGDLIFRGNRYVLQGGTIDFVNPTRTQPNVNVSVATTIQQYNVTMRFEGPVDRLRTSYTSDPALPPADIINLLAFGKPTDPLSGSQPSPPGNLGAESALAGAAAGQVTDRVEKIAGISHLSVDPTLGGNGQSPGANITIQQRVTGKIFVTFSTDITSTQNQVIQLQYQATPRVSISGTRDQNGGFGFDTRIKKTW
jgi:translocation and assembly module TamB